MLIDNEQRLTVNDGHLIDFSGTEYGSRPFDLKVDQSAIDGRPDVGVGEPLRVMARVITDVVVNAGSQVTVGVGADTDGAGTSFALLTSAVLASLLASAGVQEIGVIPAGAMGNSKLYLTARLVTDGTMTSGNVEVWLQKGSDVRFIA